MLADAPGVRDRKPAGGDGRRWAGLGDGGAEAEQEAEGRPRRSHGSLPSPLADSRWIYGKIYIDQLFTAPCAVCRVRRAKRQPKPGGRSRTQDTRDTLPSGGPCGVGPAGPRPPQHGPQAKGPRAPSVLGRRCGTQLGAHRITSRWRRARLQRAGARAPTEIDRGTVHIGRPASRPGAFEHAREPWRPPRQERAEKSDTETRATL